MDLAKDNSLLCEERNKILHGIRQLTEFDEIYQEMLNHVYNVDNRPKEEWHGEINELLNRAVEASESGNDFASNQIIFYSIHTLYYHLLSEFGECYQFQKKNT